MLRNIDVLCEKYGKLPHELIEMDGWQFDLLLLCNEARSTIDREQKQENEKYVYINDKQMKEVNDYINSLDKYEKDNALKMLEVGINPKPSIRINMV